MKLAGYNFGIEEYNKGNTPSPIVVIVRALSIILSVVGAWAASTHLINDVAKEILILCVTLGVALINGLAPLFGIVVDDINKQ